MDDTFEIDPIAVRIKILIDAKNMTVNSFAKEIGMFQATLAPQLRGDKSITFLTIRTIADAFPNLSLEWLIRGNGLMWHNRDMSSTTATQIGGSHNTINTGSQVNSLTTPSAPDPRDERIAMLQQQIDFMVGLMKMQANK